jgi:hypothetical protein
MPNAIVDITVSLDGFVTGEHADEQQELGDPPEPTREHAAGCGDTEILEHATHASGAVVRGRRFSEAYLIQFQRSGRPACEQGLLVLNIYGADCHHLIGRLAYH